jgi:hypothetical protein
MLGQVSVASFHYLHGYILCQILDCIYYNVHFGF